MLRKLKMYFRRRKCYLLSLSVCLLIMFMLAFNNQMDKLEMDTNGYNFHNIINKKDVITPLKFDVRVNREKDDAVNHDQDVNNNNINHRNDNKDDNNHVDKNKQKKPVMFIRADHVKSITEAKQEHRNDESEDGSNIDSHNDSVLKPQITDISKQNIGVIPVATDQHKTVLRTKEVFSNMTESGQKAHTVVMAALVEDQKNTHEVDLANLVITETVQFPPFVAFGKDGDPGERGKEVKETVDWSKSSAERLAEYKINQFNLGVSKKIALHRTLREMRSKECQVQTYDVSSFPTVSVVLVFHDEAWTTLLRSIHSIIDRTPATALLEVILLDDNSDQDHLGRPLEAYLQPLKIVRLIRSSKRLGLIKARNLGFLYAKGEIVVFLDSHIECFPGWLEPLVAPIVKDPRTVTFPIIPNISKDSFGINFPKTSTVGGFRIHTMTFKWADSGEEGKQYYRSPTMPGGLYAISREWFKHLGAYDPELMFWGGENLEISFKIWMCGGSIQAAACSYVGHVFRKNSPFHFDGFGKAIQKNLLRVADIWMDEFKHFYLEKFTYIFDSFGDTSVQRQLRQGLKCHSFRWYVDNVSERLKKEIDADGVYSGNIRNEGVVDQCMGSLDKSSGHIPANAPILMGCSMMHFRQVWQFRSDGYITSYDKMVIVVETKSADNTLSLRLSMDEINIDLMKRFASFVYDESHRLVHTKSGKCLDVDMSIKEKPVILATCGDSKNQRWKLQTRQELQKHHKERGVAGIEW